jgi:hypothetical protein
LKSDENILILPADKGRATVVLNKTSYQEKAYELLNDNNTYNNIKKDPTAKYKSKLVDQLKTLKDEEAIDPKLYRQLYPTTSVVPKFYGLPKVHKPSCPLRPIVASRGSITYDTAKHVASILSPLVGNTERHLKNSEDLVNKMSKFTLKPDECLVSYDVTALFTNVPVEESLVIVKDLLTADDTLGDRTDLNPQQVTDLLSTCLTTTYFVYDSKYYLQREGAAMGSPVSPIIANLFMENFENKAIASFDTPPRYWGRYVDDTMVIIDKLKVDSFTDHLNSIHESIKFTVEHESNNSIAMLDTLINRNPNGSLSFSVYRKSTHTDQYLNFASHQPLEHKLGVIRTLTHRAKTLSSNSASLESEMDHVKKSLSICGYTNWAWSAPSSRKRDPKPKKQLDRPPKGSISLPYVRGVSEAINRKIRKAGVTVHTKPSNTIRSMIVSPKDKIKTLDRTGTIYNIKCNDCHSQYVGETERNLGKRVSEHSREASPVGEHMKGAKHTFDPDQVKILDTDARWYQRGVKEAVYIAATKPDLNKDLGRHLLPSSYKKLIESCDLGNTSQSRDSNHDTSTPALPTIAEEVLLG